MTNFLKLITIIISFFLSNGALAQQITFEKNYDFGYADVAYCVQQTPDSGFIAAGRQGIAPFYEKMVILKTDKYGNEQWNKIIGTSANSAWANYIVNCTTGGYAAVGYQYDANYRYDVLVVKLNTNGDTIWTKHFGTTDFNEKGTCIKETIDKGFIISFWDNNFQTGFLKIDSSGNEIFWKKYNIYNNGYTNYFTNCSILNDGGYIACGITQIDLDTIIAPHGIIMRTDSLGDSLWVKKFIGTNGAQFYETQQTNDGNIIIGGIAGVVAIGNWGGYVLKLNIAGDTLWTKTYPLNDASEIRSIHQCADGGFVAAGSIYHYPMQNQSIYLLKLDASGNLIWMNEYGSNTEDEGGYYVRQTNDNGFIVTGVLDPGNFYLLKVDLNGNLSTGINSLNNSFKLLAYPNPTNGLLFIRSDGDIFVYTLSDYDGNILIQSEENSNYANIDLSSFANGLYILKIISNNFTITKKIIKIN